MHILFIIIINFAFTIFSQFYVYLICCVYCNIEQPQSIDIAIGSSYKMVNVIMHMYNFLFSNLK